MASNAVPAISTPHALITSTKIRTKRSPPHPSLRRPDRQLQPGALNRPDSAGRDLQLGAQSHVAVVEEPEYTANCDGLGTLRILTVRLLNLEQKTRIYQASTIHGLVQEIPQQHLLSAQSLRHAKLYGYWITVNYREAYGLYACNGILFSHESPRRKPL